MDRLPVHAATPIPALPIFAPPSVAGGAEDLHELRVRIPVDLHRQLLSLKILRGKSLAETVSLALDAYFREVAEARAATAEQAKGQPAST